MIQLIGTNPREEAPVLNARIRKAWLRGAQIGLVGEAVDLTYEYAHVGTDRATLVKLSSHKNSEETKAKRSLVIVGQGALTEADGAAGLSHAMKLAENSNSKLLVLHTAAGRVGALDGGATTINDEMQIACIEGIAALARTTTSAEAAAAYQGEPMAFGADYLIPKPFDPRLMGVVASAVAKAAMETGVASRPLEDLGA